MTRFSRNPLTYIVVALMIAVFILIYWVSTNVIWLGDDFYYQFIFHPDTTPLVASSPHINDVSDIFYSQFNHFFSSNGRLFAHFWVQLFCGILGVKWFAVLNGLAYIALFTAIVFFLRSLKNPKTWLSVIILIFLSFITKMTPSTQIGYIWMAIPNILFIYLFLKGKNYGYISLFLLAIFSLLTGNSHESYSIGISAAIIIYWIGNIRNFGCTRYVMGIAYGIGTLIICLSPAARGRAVGADVDTFQSLFFFFFSLRATYLLCLVLLYKVWVKKESIKAIYKSNSFLFNVLIVSIVFNLLVGVFCHRQLFGAELMAILIILRLIKNHSFTSFWLVASGALTIMLIGLMTQRTLIQIKQVESIFSQYENSADGLVYQDVWHPGLIEDWNTLLWENSYHTGSFRELINQKYPGGPRITVLPSSLQGKTDTLTGNTIYHYKYKPGKYILVQSKDNPSKFIVTRKFFGAIPYQNREMDFSHPIFENENCRVIVYDELFPIISNTAVSIVE